MYLPLVSVPSDGYYVKVIKKPREKSTVKYLAMVVGGWGCMGIGSVGSIGAVSSNIEMRL